MNCEWLAMGGYGTFVWSAYGISSVLLVACILIPYWRHKRCLARLRAEKQNDRKTDA